MKNVIVGTAGHIDHGKSALVEALTGTNPDRLEEEKRRGITIDLGFAFLEMDDVKLGFVDVPGHERFVKNMLAGVGGIDVLLLVVAADESIKPQTREHFDICRLLEIPWGVVALTKADVVDAETLGLVRLEVEEFLQGSFLQSAPLVPVSARTGAGLPELKAALLRVAQQAEARDTSRYFRLPVDRVFAMKGFGTVVTGTLVSGCVRAEDEAEIFPVRRRARIRGVQSAGHSAERALAGQRTALNLAGVEVCDVQRGMVLATPGLFAPTRRVDVRLKLLPSSRPMKSHARVHFHHGTAEILAEVVLLDAEKLFPGESCFAQIRLASETLLLPADHFILRQGSPLLTIGGGVVLDNLPPRHAHLSGEERQFLEAIHRGGRETVLQSLLEISTGGLSVSQAVARTGWTMDELASALRALQSGKRVELFGNVTEADAQLLSSAAVESCRKKIIAAVEAFHAQDPLLPGISREDLRGRVTMRAIEEPLFRAALAALLAEGFLRAQGEIIKRAGREIELSPEELRARQQIESAFQQAGLAVPPVKDVLAKLPLESRRAQKILSLLVREQVLVKVTEELLFHRDALSRLRNLLADRRNQGNTCISVPAFKELAGVSRKYAIPLLEYLDRNGVTRRIGDDRVIL
jgi:selenocysteine-specific elongation factor